MWRYGAGLVAIDARECDSADDTEKTLQDVLREVQSALDSWVITEPEPGGTAPPQIRRADVSSQRNRFRHRGLARSSFLVKFVQAHSRQALATCCNCASIPFMPVSNLQRTTIFRIRTAALTSADPDVGHTSHASHARSRTDSPRCARPQPAGYRLTQVQRTVTRAGGLVSGHTT
jgi:hypothetical protein